MISYDISNDRRRNRIAKILENYGKRVQYSVFEVNVQERKYQKLYSELVDEMDGEEIGNIRIYKLCARCCENIKVIGMPDISNESNGIIFV